MDGINAAIVGGSGMKIYVASKFENYPDVRRVYADLRQLGHEITLDWTEMGGPTQEVAVVEWNAIVSCDLFIGLFDKPFIFKGAWVEFGIALGHKKNCILVGEEIPQSCVFHLLPMVKVVPSIQHLYFELGAKA